MAKLRGFSGGLSGKHGNTVFRQRYGETIASQYQPIVSNPNTASQTQTRAKFKLLSQISSTLKPALAMPREGRKNSRNLFTHVNYPLTSMSSIEGKNVAEIPITAIQLTKSNHELQFTIQTLEYRTNDESVAIGLQTNSQYNQIGVCIVAGASTASSTIHPLRLKGYAVFDVDNDGRIRDEIPVKINSGESLFALFYGISESETGTREVYDNSSTAPNLALLGSTSQANRANLIFTQTKGQAVTMPS